MPQRRQSYDFDFAIILRSEVYCNHKFLYKLYTYTLDFRIHSQASRWSHPPIPIEDPILICVIICVSGKQRRALFLLLVVTCSTYPLLLTCSITGNDVYWRGQTSSQWNFYHAGCYSVMKPKSKMEQRLKAYSHNH